MYIEMIRPIHSDGRPFSKKLDSVKFHSRNLKSEGAFLWGDLDQDH